jgi:hypothetical protein
MLDLGFISIGFGSGEFRAYTDREIDKWIKIIETGNVKPD